MNYSFRNSPFGERFIPVLNRKCFEEMRSEDYFDGYLDIKLAANNTLTIVVGSDSGLLYKYLHKKKVPVGSRIIIVEHADVFELVQAECQYWLSQQKDLEISNNVNLYSFDDLQSKVFDGNDEAWFLAGEVNLAQAQCAIADYQNIYYRLYRDSQEAIAERSYQIKKNFAVKTFTKAQMLNCVDNHRAMRSDEKFGKNRVAVVLGGGPSLDDHLTWIANNRSSLFIIAVYRLCTKLNNLGLYPDLVVAIDPYTISFDSGRTGTQWSNIPLVHSYHVTPLLLQQWSGPCFYMGSRYPWDMLSGKDLNRIPAMGPTVGHAAAVLAFHLGFSKILLSGIDLCMNAQGDSHTEGTPEAELLKLPGYYEVQVTTYAGKQAGSSVNFARSIVELEKIGQQINKHNEILYNLNINAAAVSSIKHLHTEQVDLILPKPEFHIVKGEQELSLKDLVQLRKQHARFRKDFTKINEICDKALKCVDKMYKADNNGSDQVHQERLENLESRLNKAAPAMLKSIRLYMSREFSQLRKPSGFSELEKNDLRQWARDYYSITKAGCRFFLDMLAESGKTIKIREAELAVPPDVDALLKTWEDNNTRGRILKFHARFSELAKPAQIKKLKTAADNYIQSLSTESKAHDEHILSTSGSILKTMQSLRYLKEKRAISDLTIYSEKLIALEWPYACIAHYINASIAELTENEDTAIEHYKIVVDDCGLRLSDGTETIDSIGILVEESLTNLTRLFLDKQDGESAMSTLGTLCELSPQYIPSYANLLSLRGNHAAAVDVLKMYLGYATFDWRAARQLAKIHGKAGNSTLSKEAHEWADRIREDSGITHKAA